MYTVGPVNYGTPVIVRVKLTQLVVKTPKWDARHNSRVGCACFVPGVQPQPEEPCTISPRKTFRGATET